MVLVFILVLVVILQLLELNNNLLKIGNKKIYELLIKKIVFFLL